MRFQNRLKLFPQPNKMQGLLQEPRSLKPGNDEEALLSLTTPHYLTALQNFCYLLYITDPYPLGIYILLTFAVCRVNNDYLDPCPLSALKLYFTHPSIKPSGCIQNQIGDHCLLARTGPFFSFLKSVSITSQ